ncbi:MAG: AIM24 family protein, partial [Chloroflexi bacterium]|nr:AIM24 family protein [Chloroflexota bacterium]
GAGTVFLSSYGAIHLVDLADGQRHVVDSGHMVAFDESVKYEVGRSGGWKSTLLGGEGLVCKLTGPGRFYMQTRNPESFLSWLVPKLPGQRA